MKYRVLLEQDEDGVFVAHPYLAECFSQGKTRKEALKNIVGYSQQCKKT